MSFAAIRHHALTVYAIGAFAYLLLPIAVVIAFSFNDPKGRFNYVWQGFTLDQWRNWDAVPGLRDSIVLSIQIAAISSFVATALGTLIALALVRHRFVGRGPTNFLIFLPMSTPEIVLGASLLALFLNLQFATGFTTIAISHIMFNISYVVVTVKARLVGFDRHLEEAAMDLGAGPWTTFRKVTLPLIAPAILAGLFLNLQFATGFTTIAISHIMFNISYVVVTVKARLVGFDRHLEEAAMDLGAGPWTTFRKVTLPLIAPAILAGLFLAFALSVDDFVITYFNAGSEVTFPLFVWGAARIGAPPQVNVIGTAIFVIALAAMAANIFIQTRRGRQAKGAA